MNTSSALTRTRQSQQKHIDGMRKARGLPPSQMIVRHEIRNRPLEVLSSVLEFLPIGELRQLSGNTAAFNNIRVLANQAVENLVNNYKNKILEGRSFLDDDEASEWFTHSLDNRLSIYTRQVIQRNIIEIINRENTIDTLANMMGNDTNFTNEINIALDRRVQEIINTTGYFEEDNPSYNLGILRDILSFNQITSDNTVRSVEEQVNILLDNQNDIRPQRFMERRNFFNTLEDLVNNERLTLRIRRNAYLKLPQDRQQMIRDALRNRLTN